MSTMAKITMKTWANCDAILQAWTSNLYLIADAMDFGEFICSNRRAYTRVIYGAFLWFPTKYFWFQPLGNEWIVCRINRQLRLLAKLNEDFELPNSLLMASFKTRHSFRLFWTNNIYLNIEQIKLNVLFFSFN